MKDDRVYVEHVLECIGRIEEDVVGGRTAFMESHTIQDAVLRNLQTLAESTKRISDAIKVQHPEVQWRQITAFRNVLVHDYLGVDLDRVWEVTQQEIPALKDQMLRILSQLPPSE